MTTASSVSSNLEIMKKPLSERYILKYWTKGARRLYGKMGIYAVYTKEGYCLYIGQSVDLGKRVLRFFKPRSVDISFGPRTTKPIIFTSRSGEKVKYFNCYVEVTTINSRYKLDKFERLMIDIKRPIYNILLMGK